MPKSKASNLLLAMSFASALRLSPTAGEEQPEAVRVYRLRLVPQDIPPPWEDRRIGVVEFYHGGLGQEDGADAVILGRQGRVPHRVLQAGPGDLWRIAFAYDDPQAMSVAFGLPPGAKPPPLPAAFPPAWQPTAGLLLTTYALPDNSSANSWQEMERLLQSARQQPALGCDFVDQVYHGYHLFGEANAFVSCYEGWLGIPEDGIYTFATSSDDASFLFIDGQNIVSWPGQHPAVADSRYQGRAALRKGVRRFAYYHVNFGGDTIACAAWQGPGWNQIIPIAKESFAPVARFQAAPAGKGSPPILRVQRLGEAWCEGILLLRYGYEISGAPSAARRWDFGDGCSAEAEKGEHIYLTAGLRLVKAGEAIANRVLVTPDPRRAIARQYDDASAYLQEIARYPFA
ncbi:MAG: PA14 domain-containing protein, partial [Planctomycetota bacterium]|nr:PA14 domain-containing protein [Planctomycetota bacterium]